MDDAKKAMLGDREAQQKLTEKGIALPCPCCGRQEVAIICGTAVYHVHQDCMIDSRLVSLKDWNTMPALLTTEQIKILEEMEK